MLTYIVEVVNREKNEIKPHFELILSVFRSSCDMWLCPRGSVHRGSLKSGLSYLSLCSLTAKRSLVRFKGYILFTSSMALNTGLCHRNFACHVRLKQGQKLLKSNMCRTLLCFPLFASYRRDTARIIYKESGTVPVSLVLSLTVSPR